MKVLKQWLNLTSPTSDYAVYPYIGPNGNWFIENKGLISASGGRFRMLQSMDILIRK